MPTGTVSPSAIAILPSVPSLVASTSAFTFVDSISTSASPLEIASPTDFSHLMTCPSFIPMPHCGRIMFDGMA